MLKISVNPSESLSEIRNCAREDMPAVAALFQKTFRELGRAAPRSLEAYLAEAFLDHPWYDPEIASRVHVDAEGRVTGFIGVFPGRFDYRGRTVRAAIAGTLMVEHPEREPLAGAKLLRSVVKGPQDISISETTNLISQRLWEPLGGKVVPLLSLDWFRVLRPAARGACDAGRKVSARRACSRRRRVPADWIGRLMDEADLPADRAERPAHASTRDPPMRTSPRRFWSSRDADRTSPGMGAGRMSSGCSRRPRARRATDRCIARSSATARASLSAAIFTMARPGGIGRVLQILARAGQRRRCCRLPFPRGGRAGLAGLRGRCAPQLIDALLTRNCFFLHRASTVDPHRRPRPRRRRARTAGR